MALGGVECILRQMGWNKAEAADFFSCLRPITSPVKRLRQCKGGPFHRDKGVENLKEMSAFTLSFVHFMHPLLNAHPVSLFVEVKRSQGTWFLWERNKACTWAFFENCVLPTNIVCRYSAFANSCPLQTDTFLFPLIHSHHVLLSSNKF